MVGFYKHDIPAWMDGTEALSDGAYRAYHVIVQLIMLNEGPIARNERGIAGRCNQPVRTFGRNLVELLDAKKLFIDDAGRIANERASAELEQVNFNRANAGKGGKISGNVRRMSGKSLETSEKLGETSPKSPETSGKLGETSGENQNCAANPLINNDFGEATLTEERSLKEKTRLEKTREEKTETETPDEDFLPWEIQEVVTTPPAPQQADDTIVFSRGVIQLTQRQIDEMKAAFRFVKLERELGSSAGFVERKFRENQQAGRPEAWIDILWGVLSKKDREGEVRDLTLKANAIASAAEHAKTSSKPRVVRTI